MDEKEIQQEEAPVEEGQSEIGPEDIAKLILEKTGGDAEQAIAIVQRLLQEGELDEEEAQAVLQIIQSADDAKEQEEAEKLFGMEFID